MATQPLTVPANASRDVFHLRSIPFYLVHVAAVTLPFMIPFSWSLVGLAWLMYVVRIFGVTGGYHRYFSHRTYRTSRAFQFVLALLGASTLQKGPLWWSAHHRRHHRHSDQEGDLHSPGRQGFFWAHVGWILSSQHEETEMQRVPDLAKYPELRWLDDYHAVPGIALAVALYLAGGLPWLVWGFFVSTVLCWHCTFMINSLTHMFGRKRYVTRDDSRNSAILAVLTLGEGWHNNHHYWQSCTRQGFFWWEFDPTYYVLRLLALAGVVWDIKEPPKHVVEGNRVKATAAVRLAAGG
jgi:stearoyl-CoA desaturase (delta-9 desaturase)